MKKNHWRNCFLMMKKNGCFHKTNDLLHCFFPTNCYDMHHVRQLHFSYDKKNCRLYCSLFFEYCSDGYKMSPYLAPALYKYSRNVCFVLPHLLPFSILWQSVADEPMKKQHLPFLSLPYPKKPCLYGWNSDGLHSHIGLYYYDWHLQNLFGLKYLL